MKKKLFAAFACLIPILLMAQSIAMNNTKNNTTGNTITDPADNSAKTLRKAEKENRQFAKTVKVFSRDFESAPDVKWITTKNEFVASFIKDDVHTIAYYGKSGSLHYTMLTYGPDKLPKREQRIIRSDYEDYKITSVDEVHQNDIVVYVVHLESDSDIKLITICDGATSVYREYKKG